MMESSRKTFFLLVVAVVCKLGLLQSPCRHDIGDVWFLVDTKITSEVNTDSFEAIRTGLMETVKIVTNTSVEPEDVRVGLITYSDNVQLTIRPEVYQSRQKTLDALSTMRGSFTEANSYLAAAMHLIPTRPDSNGKDNFIFIVARASTFASRSTMNELERRTNLGYQVVLFSVREESNQNFLSPSNNVIVYDLRKYTDIETITKRFTLSVLCGQRKEPGLCAEADRYEQERGNMWTAVVAHPTECDKYVQCYYRFKDDLDLAIVRNCPMGLLWSQRRKECIDSQVEECNNDPCKYQCEEYKVEGSCGAYYTCSNGRSQFQCCRENYSFVPGKGCQYDPTCNDQCENKNFSCGLCRKIPNFQHPEGYDTVETKSRNYHGARRYDSNNENQNNKRGFPCLESDFNALTCDCSVTRGFACLPVHSFDFSDEKTISAMIEENMTDISASNVQFSTSGLSFEDTSSVFVNVTTGVQAFTIVFSFSNVSAISPYGQVLVSSSNVGCEGGNSLIVSATDQYVVAQLRAESLVGNIARVRVPFRGIQNGVKTVTLTYDDRHLTLSVKGDYHQYIARTTAPSNAGYLCGLTFGNERVSSSSGFTGFLHSVAIHDCAVERLYDVRE